MPRKNLKKRGSCIHEFLIANSEDAWKYYNCLKLYVSTIDRKYERYESKYYTNAKNIEKFSDQLCFDMQGAVYDPQFRNLVRLKQKRHSQIVETHKEALYDEERFIRECENKKISNKRLKFEQHSYRATKVIASTILPALTITEVLLITLVPVFPILALPAAVWSGVMALSIGFKIVAFGCLLASLAFKFQSDEHKQTNDSLEVKIRTSEMKSDEHKKKLNRHQFIVKILDKVLARGDPGQAKARMPKASPSPVSQPRAAGRDRRVVFAKSPVPATPSLPIHAMI